jgi:hypothetical protein
VEYIKSIEGSESLRNTPYPHLREEYLFGRHPVISLYATLKVVKVGSGQMHLGIASRGGKVDSIPDFNPFGKFNKLLYSITNYDQGTPK